MNKGHSSLFQVYLRLRPAASNNSGERFLAVEEDEEDAAAPTKVTLNPPNDRRRAVEKFGFTQVFEEDASQLDVFHCTGVAPLVEGVVAPHGGDGTDALIATLGVTGSGKTHTMLGSKTQHGMTQLALDLIFRSIKSNVVDCFSSPSLESSINASDASEANIIAAQSFCDNVYGDPSGPRNSSRAQTPMLVGTTPSHTPTHPSIRSLYPVLRFLSPSSPTSVRLVGHPSPLLSRGAERPVQGDLADPFATHGSSSPKLAPTTPKRNKLIMKNDKSNLHFMKATNAAKQKTKQQNSFTKTAGNVKGEHLAPPSTPRKQLLQRPSVLATHPDISGINVSCDPSAEYAVLISMYEVYNDRIFDLLSPPVRMHATKELRRRPLLFKSTEQSPDRKVVAGLRKIICTNLKEAVMVLEAALHERRVAGTGSNSVSSRSHGFFCVEVKKRPRGRHNLPWTGSQLTIVDLAGSERAKDAKTAGATLAEAGKINESLMYLGQCLQMQSDAGNSTKPNVVPFRQCKLTELLFSNSFPSPSLTQSTSRRRNPQKGVMIVTADPHGDFNSTSQILRYSALAREITVPRIPSITSTILQGGPPPTQTYQHGQIPSSPPLPSSSPILLHSRPFFPPGVAPLPSQSPPRTFSPASETMEFAALEISRLHEELEESRVLCAREREDRIAAEAHLESFEASIEDKMLDLEMAIRDEVAQEFEERYSLEVLRLQNHFQQEQERNEVHMNRKIEALGRGLGAYDDGEEEEDEDKENVLKENLEEENKRLRYEIEVMKRELGLMAPETDKRRPLAERDVSGASHAGSMREKEGRSPKKERRGISEKNGAGDRDGGLNKKMAGLRVNDGGRDSGSSVGSVRTGSPTKKCRKLAQRRLEEDDF
ncbi:Kinesin-like motor protein 9 [Zalerion maritima]|uniref:Kinesin-like protein n=1 Tax=Zalerion maritima TaxID=339359 RepID=A0AAD5RQL0_9PEZI|nr:Kinesin-like motor protein 9 [Zalerion maritima]